LDKDSLGNNPKKSACVNPNFATFSSEYSEKSSSYGISEFVDGINNDRVSLKIVKFVNAEVAVVGKISLLSAVVIVVESKDSVK
jgi:hypothetical protein